MHSQTHAVLKKRPITPAAFFRRLVADPRSLERFSEGVEGRKEVLGQFNMSAHQRNLLIGGCMRDIIGEFAGVKGTAAQTTLQNIVPFLNCGHPECEAFVKAVK